MPFTIVVTTCKAYANTTLPLLFGSMDEARVPPSCIAVVVAQCPDLKHECPLLDHAERAGVRVRAVEYAAEALTGVVCTAEDADLVQTPWFLYIQDCSVVGPNFLTRALEVYQTRCRGDAWVVKLTDRFAMSVGFYNTACVKSLAPRLAALKVYDADVDAIRAMKMHIEDAAFNMVPPQNTQVIGSFEADRRVVGEYRYEGVGTRRMVEYYPLLDYFKLKSWWGQSVDTYTTQDGREAAALPVGV